MVQLAALALQPSTFDPAGVLQTAVGLQAGRTRNALAELELRNAPERMEMERLRNQLAIEGLRTGNTQSQLQLAEAQRRQQALNAFQTGGGIGSPNAIESLVGLPDLYNQALTASNTRRQAFALENARAAQRVMALSGEDRTRAYQEEMARALQEGRITPAQHAQYAGQAPTDQFLQGIISQATPVTNEPSFNDIMRMPTGGTAAPAEAGPMLGTPATLYGAPNIAAPGVGAGPSPPVDAVQPGAVATAPATAVQAPAASAGTVGEIIGRVLPQATPAQRARFWTLMGRRETRDDAMKILQEIESGGQPLTARQRMESEEGLRREFSTLAKPYFEVRDAFSRIEVAANNPSPAGDLSLIFNYMKMLDPGSTVREGEFATAQNSAGVPERVQALYNRLISGERLTPDQRTDFASQSRSLMQVQERQYLAIQGQYGEIARRSGVNPQNVLVDFTRPPSGAQPGPQQPQQPARSGPTRISNDAEYHALPPGTEYVGPDGIRRIKPGQQIPQGTP
jgi:hypothetical protein